MSISNPMTLLTMGIPAFYYIVVLGLCSYLLIRGVAHGFVVLFAVGAVVELLRTLAYISLSIAPGGISASAGLLPLISVIGLVGMVIFTAAFVSLTVHLLAAAPSPDLPPV